MESLIKIIKSEKINYDVNIKKYVKKSFFYLIAFFISRINFFDIFSIFGLALYISGVKCKVNDVFFKISLILGVIAGGNDKYLAILICFMFFTFLIEYKNEKIKSIGFELSRINTLKLAIIFATLYILLDVFLSFNNENFESEFFWLVYSKCFLNAILIITTGTILTKSIKIFFKRSGSMIKINDEYIICASFITILTLIGMNGIFIRGIYLEELVILLLIEVTSYVTNGYTSVFIGTLLSIPLMIENRYMFNFSGISIIGLIMGNLRKTNKWMYSVIFFAISSMFYLMMADSLNLTITFMSSLVISQMIFLIIPKVVYDKLANDYDELSKLKRKNYYEKFKEKVEQVVKNQSEKFYTLADTYESVVLDKKETKISDKRKIIDDLMLGVCKGCINNSTCLKNNFYKTYSNMLEDISLCEEKEKLKIENLNLKKCVRSEEYVECIYKKLQEIRKEENIIKEDNILKDMIKRQFLEAGKSIENLGNELVNYKACRTYIEDDIYELLERRGIDLKFVDVSENVNKNIIIELGMSIEYEKLLTKITNVISRYLRVKYDFEILEYDKEMKDMKIILKEKEKFTLKYGLFESSKDEKEISGDRYSIIKYANGKVMVSLADGMGKGKKARNESKKVIELLESVVSLGFDDEYMIEFINSNMYGANKEEYATLDVAIIDTYTGECKFIKNAAMTTFVKRKNEIFEIEGNSMPIGIINSPKASLSSLKIEKGDRIFMLTDGVIDNINTKGSKKQYLKEVLSLNSLKTIQSLVNQIGIKISIENILKDDMTLIGIEVE